MCILDKVWGQHEKRKNVTGRYQKNSWIFFRVKKCLLRARMEFSRKKGVHKLTEDPGLGRSQKERGGTGNRQGSQFFVYK